MDPESRSTFKCLSNALPFRAQAREGQEVTGCRRVNVSVAWRRSPGSDPICSCRKRQVAGVHLKHDTRGHRNTSKLHVIIVKIFGIAVGELAESAVT